MPKAGKKVSERQRVWAADKVEHWPLASLIPYARNARIHSQEQVEQLAASMREFGWTIPILAAEDGEIIAGHGRVMAAELLGIDEAPVLVAHGWSEAQKKAYRLADNKLTENSTWDRELLALELGELESAGTDIGGLGWQAAELQELLSGMEGRGGGLDDLAKKGLKQGVETLARDTVPLTFHFRRADRDLVVWWLSAETQRRNLATTAEALLALARADHEATAKGQGQ